MKKESELIPIMRSRRLRLAASFMWAFMCTLLITSSVVQASDMQIYAVPTGGKKTMVMMLDTSGSMGYSVSSGYSLYDDYGLRSNTCTVYYENSITSPSYPRYFCTVPSNTTNLKVKDEKTGCEKQSNGSYRCYDRLTRLKDGMFDFLNSNNLTLNNVSVGLGHFSTYTSGTTGDGNSGEILVPAANLAAVNSAQRIALKNAVAGLEASNGTPTANAFAEAAAYLMGTNTVSSGEITKDFYKKVTTSTQVLDSYECNNSTYSVNGNNGYCYKNYTCTSTGSSCRAVATKVYRTDYTDNYYQCKNWDATNFDDQIQECKGRTGTSSSYWISLGTSPLNLNDYTPEISGATTYYKKDEYQTGSSSYSGFNKSVDSSKDPATNYTTYKSPLPAPNDRVSCDGQGIYILSDGDPTANNVKSSVLASALNRSSYSGSGGLSGGNDWDYMSNFARDLYNGGATQTIANKITNPVNVPIQTAFVGFGAALNNVTGANAINACKLSSRTQSDRDGDDLCSPNQDDNPQSAPGFGNGGFFPTQTPQGVTDSVIAFIGRIGRVPLNPLTTGAISVPVDPLTSNGFQSYGYLRALEPNPANPKLIWLGNLKKYQVLLDGTNAGAFADKNSNLIYDSKGGFVESTKDLWNSSTYNDGGIIKLGGAYSKVPMPALGQTENLDLNPKLYAFASTPDALRTLFTDVASTGGASLAGMSNNGSLLRIPEGPVPTSNVTSYVLSKLKSTGGQTTLKDFPLLAKLKVLNYLGYSVPLGSDDLPASLTTPKEPSFAMGGSIHSFPVQLTYSGALDANGDLTATRDQSVLYGSMEGGLHIVNGNTGVEQMVFVPSEILRNPVASKALVKGEEDLLSPTAGVDGAWVADPAYKVSNTGSSITARQMNVYGGLRMGGNSYYGLDVLDPSSPKLLFRAGSDQSDFSRMGQSWSKPVLANIRYNGAIKRVMIVGGGYDTCYESPTATLTAGSCGTEAKGNAVYIIDAKTGERLWWASSSGSSTNNANMKHSIVSRIGVLDRNADGLIDHLYFGDLGGQVFRADLNNNQTKTGSSYSSFGVRVVRLANLATTSASVALTDGKNPRFYEAPTVTIHDQGGATFIVVGIASGNRSTPLDVFPIQGRDGMSPAVALTDRLVNNVYGIIDRDFINSNLMTVADSTLITKDKNLSTFQKDPQKLASGSVISVFIPASGAGKDGWYRSLSSKSDGTERADNSFRIKGGLKAFEEPIALTGNLIVPVYDPQGTGIAPASSCKPRVVGETDRQLYCLPFGVCLNSNGTTNTVEELKTGFLTTTDTAKCPAGVAECNDNTLGAGIRGVSLAPLKPNPDPDSCGKLTLAGNEKGAGEWQCTRKLNPTRWYEKYTSP